MSSRFVKSLKYKYRKKIKEHCNKFSYLNYTPHLAWINSYNFYFQVRMTRGWGAILKGVTLYRKHLDRNIEVCVWASGSATFLLNGLIVCRRSRLPGNFQCSSPCSSIDFHCLHFLWTLAEYLITIFLIMLLFLIMLFELDISNALYSNIVQL